MKPHRLLPFNGKEAEKVVKASRAQKSRLLVSDAVRQRIARAVVLIHHEARYFEGMAILAGMAGWRPRILENEYDNAEEQLRTRNEFNKWVKQMRGF